MYMEIAHASKLKFCILMDALFAYSTSCVLKIGSSNVLLFTVTYCPVFQLFVILFLLELVVDCVRNIHAFLLKDMRRLSSTFT